MSSADLGIAVIERLLRQDLDTGVGQKEVAHPQGGKQRGDQVNLGSFAVEVKQAWAPVSVLPTSIVQTPVNVHGARVGDFAVAVFDGAGYLFEGNLHLHAKVDGPDSCLVTMYNHSTSSTYNPGSGTLRVLVFRLPPLE